MADLTGDEITALADTVDIAIDDQEVYLFGVGGLCDYTDEEWPEVCELKAKRFEDAGNAMQKYGQTAAAEKWPDLRQATTRLAVARRGGDQCLSEFPSRPLRMSLRHTTADR